MVCLPPLILIARTLFAPMFQPLSLALGMRFVRAKRDNAFISFISATSVVGIALGMTALITIMSVMNGFQQEVRTRLLGMTAHATVTGVDGSVQAWEALIGGALSHPEVLGAAPYIDGQAMLSTGLEVSGALVRGIEPGLEASVADTAAQMVEGSLDALQPKSFSLAIGRGLATTLGVGVGDKVTVLIPQASVTPIGVVPRNKRFTVGGIFEAGMYEFDHGMVLMHFEDASLLWRRAGSASGVRLKLADLDRAPEIGREVGAQLGQEFWVSDWTQLHSNYFKAVRTEKRVMFVILALIIAVAAFNIVSTLVMVVNEKRSDIAILRTIGASPLLIMRVFLVQGSLIGFAGTVVGAVCGVALALNVTTVVPWIEQLFGANFLDPSVYLISEIPSLLLWSDVASVVLMSLGLSVLATLYPSWRASRTEPAEALRYD